MASFFRNIGRRLREYVRPLVGFWDLFIRLEELREYAGRQESTSTASHELLLQFQARVGHIESELTGRLDRLTAALTARDGALVTTVATEVDRLDGYLTYHAATLQAKLRDLVRESRDLVRESVVRELVRESVVAIRGDLDPLRDLVRILASRSQRAYTAPGLDALVVTAACDLIVPTDEAGLLAYILRHGLEAIEPGVQAIVRGHLKSGAVAVDAGANIGVHSINMASAVGPEGCVLCFEPLPHLAKALERTLRLNGFSDRARVHQMALADTTGNSTLHRASHGPMSSLFALPQGMESESIPVRVVTLDDSFAPGARVDLVKMDVEGAEPKIWRGMQRILQENSGIEIILEWSASHFRRAGEDPAAFMAEIRAAGFSPFVIEDDRTAGRLMPLHGGVEAVEAKNLFLTRCPVTQYSAETREVWRHEITGETGDKAGAS